MLSDIKKPNGKYNLHYELCTGDFLGPPHGTTPAAVIANLLILICGLSYSIGYTLDTFKSQVLVRYRMCLGDTELLLSSIIVISGASTIV